MSKDNYTPTAEEVRAAWMNDGPPASTVVRALVFERWYAAELAAAEKRGWDECVNEAGDLGLIHDIGVREMLALNPHRADQIEEGT